MNTKDRIIKAMKALSSTRTRADTCSTHSCDFLQTLDLIKHEIMIRLIYSQATTMLFSEFVF